MYLVVGSTGLLGGDICRRLAEAGHPVKALVRTTSAPERVEALRHSGVVLAHGDLKDRASLDAACQGVTTVISTASATLSRQDGDSLQTVDLEGHIRLIDAAREAGVGRVIYISFRHDANPALQYPLKEAKRTVEQHLIGTGLQYTILQASYFMEVWLSPALGFDYGNAKASIYGAGHNPVRWVSYTDVAQFAIAALDHPAAQNAILEVGGPEALSPLEVVRVFEAVKGEAFTVEHVPEEALLAQKAAAPDALQETFAALMLQYAAGDAFAMDTALEIFAGPLTSVQAYARQVLGQG